MLENQLKCAIKSQIAAALWECCPPDSVKFLLECSLMNEVLHYLMEDVCAFCEKDPSSKGDTLVVIQASTSFRAVIHYRLSSMMWRISSDEKSPGGQLPLLAALVSSRGKILSGAELHHKCQIGRRFVLDHGIGTVLGETSVVGNDCYILGGVTLGASGISGNHPGKRHPSVGDRVEIGAFSRIFGNVSVGNDVFIGPQCTITDDIPPFSRVTLRTSLQVVRTKNLKSEMAFS
jgi:serine O-acetyltransferase